MAGESQTFTWIRIKTRFDFTDVEGDWHAKKTQAKTWVFSF